MEDTTGRDAHCETTRGDAPRTVQRGPDSQSDNTQTILPTGSDWWRGSLPHEERTRLQAWMEMLFGPGEQQQFGLWGYDRQIRWSNGASIQYHSTDARLEITKGRITAELPGKALRDFDLFWTRHFMRDLKAMGFVPTRLDLYHDDFERIITPREIFSQVYEPSLYTGAPIRADFTGFLRIQHKQEHHRTKGITHDEVDFGRRGNMGSGKYLRIYDKGLESKGVRDCVRYELELSGPRAVKAWDAICSVQGETPEEIEAGVASVIGSVIGACVDFRVRTGEKNLGRLQRYEWWSKILDRLGRRPELLRIPREPKKVQRSYDYMRTQVSGTLQMLHEAFGPEHFLPVLVDIVTSTDKLRASHWQAIQAYRNPNASGLLDVKHFREYADENEIPLEDSEGENEDAMSELQDEGIDG